MKYLDKTLTIGKIISITLLLTANIYADEKAGYNVYLNNCANCHSNNMKGGLGKDFNMVSYTRSKKDIMSYIQNPEKMFKKFGYSSNAMPTLPISIEEMEDVTEYIDSLQPFKKWMKRNS